MVLPVAQGAAAVGRVPADGAGLRVLHPLGPRAAAAGARRAGAGGGRRLSAARAALVRLLARTHARTVPHGLRLRLRRLPARRHAHTDHIL